MPGKKRLIESYLDCQDLLILDGGLATELERRGASLAGKLWSARMLIENPGMIRSVHRDFLEAGADVIISASYQASIPGFKEAGMTALQAADLIRLSVELACEARDEFSAAPGSAGRLRPLIAASVGPYGACLADGSEYHGNYGLSKQELIEFHRPRMEILAQTEADFLAFETIPSLLEAEALLELIREFQGCSAWLSFSCKDEKHVSHGEPFADCAALADRHHQIFAVGVNCTKPAYISPLLESAGPIKSLLLAYPNSGEEWDAAAHNWSGEGGELTQIREWAAAGARLVGGCCRVGPETIAMMRKTLLG
jgi:homocysteine S-methyltransferase